MQTTQDLLTKALTIHSAAKWAETLDLTRQTFANAKRRGRLSPVLAGNIAINLGENPKEWIAIAAMEAEPESEAKRALLARLTSL